MVFGAVVVYLFMLPRQATRLPQLLFSAQVPPALRPHLVEGLDFQSGIPTRLEGKEACTKRLRCLCVCACVCVRCAFRCM